MHFSQTSANFTKEEMSELIDTVRRLQPPLPLTVPLPDPVCPACIIPQVEEGEDDEEWPAPPLWFPPDDKEEDKLTALIDQMVRDLTMMKSQVAPPVPSQRSSHSKKHLSAPSASSLTLYAISGLPRPTAAKLHASPVPCNSTSATCASSFS